MRIFFYMLGIVIANVITAMFAPIQLGLLLIPAGTFLIGATFILRDLVQERYGKKKTYLIIGITLVISAISSVFLGDILAITIASAISFLVSELTDTEIYSRMKTTFAKRVLVSGLVGGTLDSIIFVIIGLSPLLTNMLTWQMVPYAILGQLLMKAIMQILGVGVIKLFIRK